MKTVKLCTAVLLLTSFTNLSLADTTFVGDPRETTHISGVWDLDGSPYLLRGTIVVDVGDTVLIHPGVEVLFAQAVQCFMYGVFVADGTLEDTIHFRHLPPRSYAQIQVTGESAHLLLNYCHFDTFSVYNPFGTYDPIFRITRASAEISNTFMDYSDGFNFSSDHGHDCKLSHSYFGFGAVGNIDTIEYCLSPRLIAAEGIIINSGFFSFGSGGGFIGFRGGRTTLINSAIYSRRIFESERQYVGEMRYSWIRTSDDPSNWGIDIEGFGILDRVNANGDSTDRYGNLFMEQGIVGQIDDEWHWPESFFLLPESPCIDAGDPESDPDPDGTVADIGAFNFHQRDIQIDPDTLDFVDIIEATDTLDLTIRNIGLTTLHIASPSISPEESPFAIVSGGGEVEVEPQSEHVMSIAFAPPERGDYRAVLNIISDDPDEDTVAVPLIGSALDVEEQFILHPSSFILYPAFPNPFNSTTAITFQLANPARVSLAVYDLNGRLVDVMIDERMSGGIHAVSWQPETLASGLYFVRLDAGGMVQTRKVVLMR